MAINVETVVALVKQRKDMMPGISQRDDYITERVKAVISEMAGKGIHLVDDPADVMLAVDMTAWQYKNRDQSGAMPEWLRLARRERWLNDRKINEDYAAKLAEQAEVNADDP